MYVLNICKEKAQLNKMSKKVNKVVYELWL